MARPEGWVGSDMRARAEVVQWLHDHGDEVHDPQGLVVGRMRTELGKGRALSQLIADMVKDGMLAREVNGRRTMMIKLVDDWGLLNELGTKGYRQVAQPAPAKAESNGGPDLADVDLTALAETLLALVLKRAQVQPSRGAESEKLKEKVAEQKAQIQQLRDDLILARDSEAEQRRQADSMRESLAKLQKSMDKKKSHHGPAGGGPIEERLSASEQRLLKQLMEQLPSGR